MDQTGGEMRYSQLGEEDRALLTETEFAMVKLVDKDPATHNSFTIDVTRQYTGTSTAKEGGWVNGIGHVKTL